MLRKVAKHLPQKAAQLQVTFMSLAQTVLDKLCAEFKYLRSGVFEKPQQAPLIRKPWSVDNGALLF